MAATFVGAETAVAGTEVTSLAVDVHEDTLDGDFMLLTYWKDDDTPGSHVATAPDGWTPIMDAYWWRTANSEPASYTVITNSPRRAVATIAVWRGLASIAPITEFDTDDIGTGDTHTCPALTVPSGDYLLIAGVETDGGGVTFTPPTGFTLAAEDESGGTGVEHSGGALAYKTYTGTSPATADFTTSASVFASITAQLAVRVLGTAGAGVFIDWDNDGFDVGDHDAIHEESGNRVISWTISRGASAEITGGSTPGSATLVLKNPSDIYNPRNASGALYGVLRDGTPIWIGVNADGALTGSEPIGLFGGRITDITLIPSPGTDDPATVEFVCEDMLSWAQRAPIQLDYAEGRSHAELREAGLIAAGESRYDLAHEIHTMPLSNADGSLSALLDGINSINGTRHLARPGASADEWYRYTTRNRQYKLAGVADESLDAGSQHVTGTDGWRLSADTVINQQKATVTPVQFTPSTFTVWEAEQLPIVLDDDHTYTRIVAFDDMVADASLDIASTGDTVISTLTPFATGAKIELSVGSGDEATITALSIEGRLARRLPQESYVADDTTSQAAPRGIRAGSEIGNEYLGVLASATGIATHVVWRYGNPQLRPTLTVENWFPQMFQLDVCDVISFTSTHLGMTDRLFEIVGLTHEGHVASSSVKHHTVTYVLQESRVQTATAWFVLDTSELDSADMLAY